MTKHVVQDTPATDRPAFEIEITPAMIDAGVRRLRDFHFGEPEDRIVEAVYLAMAIEQRPH
jgi:hypothetical protein